MTPLIHQVAPAYASGNVHLGHILQAVYWSVTGKMSHINKYVKDLTLSDDCRRLVDIIDTMRPHLTWGCDVNGSPIVRKVIAPGEPTPPDLPDRCRKYVAEKEKVMNLVYRQWGLLQGYDHVDYYRTDDPQMTCLLRAFIDKCHDKRIIRETRMPVLYCPACQVHLSKTECSQHSREGLAYHVKVWDEEGNEHTLMTTHPEWVYGLSGFAYRSGDERYRHLEGKTLSFTPDFSWGVAMVRGSMHISGERGTGLCYIGSHGSQTDIEVLRSWGDTSGSRLYGDDGTPLGRTPLSDLHIVAATPTPVGVVVHSERSDCMTPVVILTPRCLVLDITDELKAQMKERFTQFDSKTTAESFHNLVATLDHLEPWTISRDPSRYFSLRIPGYPQYVADTWLISSLLTQRLPGRYSRFMGTEIEGTWLLRTVLVECIMDSPRLQGVVRHGLILDGKGRKISKSLQNGPDHEQLCRIYGKTLLKIYLLSNTPHKNVKYDEGDLLVWKKVLHKLQSLSRLCSLRLEGEITGQEALDLSRTTPLTRMLQSIVSHLRGDAAHIPHHDILARVREDVYHISRDLVTPELSRASWVALKQKIHELQWVLSFYE